MSILFARRMASYTASQWRETSAMPRPWSGRLPQSRVYSFDLGQALLESAPLSRELAQLLGEYLVLVHLWVIPPQPTDRQLGGGAPDVLKAAFVRPRARWYLAPLWAAALFEPIPLT